MKSTEVKPKSPVGPLLGGHSTAHKPHPLHTCRGGKSKDQSSCVWQRFRHTDAHVEFYLLFGLNQLLGFNKNNAIHNKKRGGDLLRDVSDWSGAVTGHDLVAAEYISDILASFLCNVRR